MRAFFEENCWESGKLQHSIGLIALLAHLGPGWNPVIHAVPGGKQQQHLESFSFPVSRSLNLPIGNRVCLVASRLFPLFKSGNREPEPQINPTRERNSMTNGTSTPALMARINTTGGNDPCTGCGE